MPAIQLENFKKYYGATKAVDGISLTVEVGDIFGFLGPNGAGKTTTIRSMMDFIRPTAGVITLFGKNAQQDSVELKKQIGYLSSDTHLYNTWTGREHIKFVQAFKGEFPQLEPLLERLDFNPAVKVKKLSTGNKQKLNLILALIGQPKLLILDEPTRGLDPILQNEVYRILLEFKQQGGTVFFSSHNLAEVEHICNRVAIIRKGQLVTVEDIKDLKGKNIHVGHVAFTNAVLEQDILVDNVVLAKDSAGFSFRLTGDVSAFFNKIGQQTVKDFEMSHATLEDVFLAFYKE